MRLADRLGGHLVQGHVDGVGTVRARDAAARRLHARRRSPRRPTVLRYVVEKGSITVDGISLTVAALDDADGVRRRGHPAHARGHHARAREPGDPVNLEVDVLAKYVERLLAVAPRIRRTLTMPFTEIEDAIAAIARGELVVVVDDADRENEGDLIMAAETMTPEAMAFMIRHTSGVICMPVEGERLDELRLPLMVRRQHRERSAPRSPSRSTPATAPPPASPPPTAATTVHALLDPATRPEDLARPGHIFPLRYREGGVLKRAGHTEAAVDLARLAGLLARRRARRGRERRRHDGARCPSSRSSRPSTGCSSSRSPISSATAATARSSCAASRRPASRRGTATSPRYVFESLLDGTEHLAFVRGEVAGPGERARARALRVPHRRRVRLDALRLRPAARRARWS